MQRVAIRAFLFLTCCSPFAQATIIFTVTDAGAGNTSWSISGSGVGIPFHPSTISEVIVPSYFGNLSFVSGGNGITGTGNWNIGGLPVSRVNWIGEGGFDGLNDFLVLDLAGPVGAPLDLSTASGTVIFPIPISAFTSPSYLGASLDSGGSKKSYDVGSVYINVPSVPEPTTVGLGTVAILGLLSRRHPNRLTNSPQPAMGRGVSL